MDAVAPASIFARSALSWQRLQRRLIWYGQVLNGLPFLVLELSSNRYTKQELQFFVNAQIILEGMGRALHTNLNARFKCDALKVRWFYQIFVFLLVESIFLFFVGNLIDGDIGTCFHSWR